MLDMANAFAAATDWSLPLGMVRSFCQACVQGYIRLSHQAVPEAAAAVDVHRLCSVFYSYMRSDHQAIHRSALVTSCSDVTTGLKNICQSHLGCNNYVQPVVLAHKSPKCFYRYKAISSSESSSE